jgi:hypothetical protein
MSFIRQYTINVPATEAANVRIRAVNAEGAGPASDTKTATPTGPAIAPAQMSAPTLAGGTNAATLTLAAPPHDGGSAITSYAYEVTTAADAGFASPVAQGTQTPANRGTPISLDPLTAGDYIARSRAINAIGSGAWSAASPVATVSDPVAAGAIQAEDWLLIDRGPGNDPVIALLRPPSGLDPEDVSLVTYSTDGGATWQANNIDDHPVPAGGLGAPGRGVVRPADYTEGAPLTLRVAVRSARTGQILTDTASADKTITPGTAPEPTTQDAGLPIPSTHFTVTDGAADGRTGTLKIEWTEAGKTWAASQGIDYWWVRISTSSGPAGGGVDEVLWLDDLINGEPYEIAIGCFAGANRVRSVGGGDVWSESLTVTPTHGGPPAPPEDAQFWTMTAYPAGYDRSIAIEWGPIPADRDSAITAAEYRVAQEIRTTEAATSEGEIGAWGSWVSIPPPSRGDITTVSDPGGSDGAYVQVRFQSAEGPSRATPPVYVAPFSGTAPAQPAVAGRIYITSEAEWNAFEANMRQGGDYIDANGITEVKLVGDGTLWRSLNYGDGWEIPATPYTISGLDGALPAHIDRIVVPAGGGGMVLGAGFVLFTPLLATYDWPEAERISLRLAPGSQDVTTTDLAITHALPRSRETDGLRGLGGNLPAGGNSITAIRVSGSGHLIQQTDLTAPSIERVHEGVVFDQSTNVMAKRVWVRGVYADGFQHATGPITGLEMYSCFTSDAIGWHLIKHPDAFHGYGQPGGTEAGNTVNGWKRIGCGFFAGKETGVAPPYLANTYDKRVRIIGAETAAHHVRVADMPGVHIVTAPPSDTQLLLPPNVAGAAIPSDGFAVARTPTAEGYAGTVTLVADGTDTVDGAATKALTGDWEILIVKRNGDGIWTTETTDLSLNGVIWNSRTLGPAGDVVMAGNLDALPMGSAYRLESHDHQNTVIAYNITLQAPDPSTYVASVENGLLMRTVGGEAGECAVARNVLQGIGEEDWSVPDRLNYQGFPATDLAAMETAVGAQFAGTNGDGTGFVFETPADLIAGYTPRAGADALLAAAAPQGKYDFDACAWTALPAPALDVATPPDGATVAPGAPLKLTFDAPIRSTGAGSATLYDVTNAQPVAGVTVTVTGLEVIFTPGGDLPAADYEMRITGDFLVSAVDGTTPVAAQTIAFTVSGATLLNYVSTANKGVIDETTYIALTNGIWRYRSTTPAHWSAAGVPYGETVVKTAVLRGTNTSVSLEWYNASPGDNGSPPGVTADFNNTTGNFIASKEPPGTRATDDADPATGDYGVISIGPNEHRVWVKMAMPSSGDFWFDWPDDETIELAQPGVYLASQGAVAPWRPGYD